MDRCSHLLLANNFSVSVRLCVSVLIFVDFCCQPQNSFQSRAAAAVIE
jgi:hypothetical protein